MTKKHEELVEEVANHLLDVYGGAFSSPSYRILSKRIITLIFSAVRDGQLDKELGVVGRGEIRRHGPLIWKTVPPDYKEWLEFIALSGTSQGDPVGGKEE